MRWHDGPHRRLIAYNASTGALLWSKRYNGPASASDAAYSIGVSPSGDQVFVTGFSTGNDNGAQSFDYATVAYDATTGSRSWVSRFSDPGNPFGSDQATALAVSPDGSQVIVTGRSQDVDGVSGYATVAYATLDGQEAWSRRYAAPGASADYNYGATALAISPDSLKVFVTGASQDATGDFDYATLAYDTAAGGDLWLKRYDGAANDFDVANALALSPDGSAVFVTGTSWGADYDYATIGYNAATGTPLWTKRYNGVVGGADDAKALVVSPDGATVFVTGESWRNADTGDTDYATLAYGTTTGARAWLKRYNGPHVQDYGRALAVSPNGGRLFVTGRSMGNSGAVSDFDYTTVAYKAN